MHKSGLPRLSGRFSPWPWRQRMGCPRRTLVFLCRHERTQIMVDGARPKLRPPSHKVTLANRHIELKELALAAGLLEGGEIVPAVSNRIKRVVLTVKPDRWPSIRRSSLEKPMVHGARGRITFAEPAADKIDDAGDLLGMQSCIGYRQHAPARHTTDEDRCRGNVLPSAKGCDRGIDVTQCTIRASKCYVDVAGVSASTVLGEAFVVEPVGFATAATLRKSNDPSAVIQEISKIGGEPGVSEQVWVHTSPGRSMIDHGRGKGPAPAGRKITASRRTGLPSSIRSVCKNSDLPRVHATTASGLVRDARSALAIVALLALSPRSKRAFRLPSSVIS